MSKAGYKFVKGIRYRVFDLCSSELEAREELEELRAQGRTCHKSYNRHSGTWTIWEEARVKVGL